MRFAAVCLAAAMSALLVTPTGIRRERTQSRRDALADNIARFVVDAFARHRPADRVGELCSAMCAELRAGSAPTAALLAATEHNDVAPHARAAAILGEPVAQALLKDARVARAAGLAGVAACWTAAAESGAGLADGLERVAALSAAQRKINADLETETAGPRATARVLSLLPLFGIFVGELLGARPVAWLIGSPLGFACLSCGLGFLAVGSLWTRHIVRSAEPDIPLADG